MNEAEPRFEEFIRKPKEQDVMVDHPPHYQSETGMEVIDVIEALHSI